MSKCEKYLPVPLVIVYMTVENLMADYSSRSKTVVLNLCETAAR
jgi:hypothetical protein